MGIDYQKATAGEIMDYIKSNADEDASASVALGMILMACLNLLVVIRDNYRKG